MRIIRNISILLAGTLLILHTLLPHDHHSQISESDHIAQHESATNIFDFLQLAFHLDQGKEHLEKYQTTWNEINCTPNSFEISNFNFNLEIQRPLTGFPTTTNTEAQHHRILSPQIRFRGPPTLT